MDKNNNFIGDSIIGIFATVVGAVIMAIGVALFLLPNQLSSGGVSGIATIVYYFLNVPMGITIILINIPIFLFARLKLGRQIFINSIIGTASLSIFIDLIDRFPALTNDRLLASIYGGILIGLGTGIVLKHNSSTGGSELFSQIIKKYNNNIPMGTILIIVDVIVVSLNVIFFKEIEVGLYSGIGIYIAGKMVDIIFEGIYFTKLVLIISEQSVEIAKQIGEKIPRGTTGIYGKGMYTGRKKLILMCAVGRRDVAKVRKLTQEIDPKCFIIITNSREVLGEGFKKE